MQVKGRSVGRHAHGDIAYFMFGLKFSGGIDGDTLVSEIQLATGQGDVTCLKDVGEILCIEAVGCQALLRIEEINLLRKDARANDLGDQGRPVRSSGCGEQCLLHGVRKLVELAVTVLCTSHRGQLGWNFGGIANNKGLPGIGMGVQGSIALRKKGMKTVKGSLVVRGRLPIDADKAWAVKNANVLRGVPAARIFGKLVHPKHDHSLVYCRREAVQD